MNDTPLTVEVENSLLKAKTDFLKEFKIPDFVCYSIDNKAVSLVVEYRLNYKNFKATKNVDNKVQAELINFITNEIEEVEQFLANTEKPENYNTLKEEKETLENILKNNPTLPKEKQTENIKRLETIELELSNLRNDLFFKEIENTKDTQKLLATPKLAKLVLGFMAADNTVTEYQEIDPEGKEAILKNKIVKYFFEGHDKTKEEVESIKKKMTISKFKVLCVGICQEPENGLDISITDFFVKTLSIQN
jgi:hypothetical protein